MSTEAFSISQARGGPDERVAFDWFEGFMVTSVFAALEMSGLLELLEGPGIEGDTLGEDEASALLHASLLYLVQRGLLEVQTNRFELTALGQRLCEDKGYLVWLSGGYGEPLHYLAEFLLGRCRYGVEHKRDGRWVATGTALAGAADIVPHATAMLAELSFRRVLDLGCGNARFLISVCERFGCSGVGVDIDPAACDEARRELSASAVAERVSIVMGDAVELEQIALEETDLVLSFFLLHEIFSISRATLVGVLEGMASRLPHGAHVLVAEMEPPRQRNGHNERFTPEFALVHSLMRQKLLRELAWREVLSEGGFVVERVVRPRTPGGLLLLARPGS